ncbi:MAG TPA: TolC family protein, partial [Longimicrobiales bacterium]|nr:TolC family protein [Longimicrobiales bacterium]
MTLRAALVLLVAASPTRAQAPPTTLADYLAVARTSNPMVRAARAAVDAAAAGEPSAGLLPDPMVQLGIMNASLPGLRTDMPGAMAPSIQVMQRVQLPGTLRLSAEMARQTTAMARSAADEAWWEVRTRVALAFYDVYRADRQLVVMGETLDWLAQLEEVALTMYATGGGTQGDVLRAGVESARMKADVARMQAMRTAAAARLNSLLDRPADADVAPPQVVPLSADVPDGGVLEAWATETRPLLAQARTALSRARTEE